MSRSHRLILNIIYYFLSPSHLKLKMALKDIASIKPKRKELSDFDKGQIVERVLVAFRKNLTSNLLL